MSEALHLDDDAFQALVASSTKPVLVDFWAPWCGPCRQIAPAIDALAKDKADSLVVVKINVDESPAAAARYGVRGIPALMIFKGGVPVASQAGAVPQQALFAWAEGALR